MSVFTKCSKLLVMLVFISGENDVTFYPYNLDIKCLCFPSSCSSWLKMYMVL